MGQLYRFLLVGLGNTGVGLLCIWGTMHFLALNDVAANFIGYACGLFLGFAMHRSWTFTHGESISRSFPRWLAVAAMAYLVNLGVLLLAHRLGGVDPYLAQPLGIGAYTTIMFLGSRYYVFCNPGSFVRESG
jgi:putative flippase GtrA